MSRYNGGGNGAFVNSGNNPSIFSFYWGGGALTIEEEIGINGTGDAIDVALWSLASVSATTSSAELDSIVIPYTSGDSSVYDLAQNQSLSAGYYAVETQLGTPSTDPSFQINFIPAATPEPATLTMVGTGIAACATAIRRRRMRSTS